MDVRVTPIDRLLAIHKSAVISIFLHFVHGSNLTARSWDWEWVGMVKWNGPFQWDRSNREKWPTSKGGPIFPKLFRLDRTDPFSFRPEIWLNGSRPMWARDSPYGVYNFLSKWRQRTSLQVKFLACSTVDFPQQISRDWQVAPPTVRKINRHYQRYGTFSAFSRGGSEPCKVTAQWIEIWSFKTNMVIGFNVQIINRSIICILETASGLHVQIINLLLHSWNDYRVQYSNNQFIN